MRTWTATIEVREAGVRLALDAVPSEYDLLRDQTLEAIAQATRFLTDTSDVSVTLFKTTKARGTERDRSFQVFRDRRGQVRYQ